MRAANDRQQESKRGKRKSYEESQSFRALTTGFPWKMCLESTRARVPGVPQLRERNERVAARKSKEEEKRERGEETQREEARTRGKKELPR